MHDRNGKGEEEATQRDNDTEFWTGGRTIDSENPYWNRSNLKVWRGKFYRLDSEQRDKHYDYASSQTYSLILRYNYEFWGRRQLQRDHNHARVKFSSSFALLGMNHVNLHPHSVKPSNCSLYELLWSNSELELYRAPRLLDYFSN